MALRCTYSGYWLKKNDAYPRSAPSRLDSLLRRFAVASTVKAHRRTRIFQVTFTPQRWAVIVKRQNFRVCPPLILLVFRVATLSLAGSLRLVVIPDSCSCSNGDWRYFIETVRSRARRQVSTVCTWTQRRIE